MTIIVPSLFDSFLSDVGFPPDTISKIQAEKLFIFFSQHPLFNWKSSNNGCEGKADAICVLLDEWKIPNYKAWVFSGFYLKKHIGQLKQNWNYHVATVLPVEENGQILYYVLDPATGSSLQLVDDWATGVTQLPHSYYAIRQSHWYIFPGKKISTEKWNTRNRQNRKWMIQCLAGINGLTASGKAKLCFTKGRLRNIAATFEKAKLKPVSVLLSDV
ncbi:MAG: protein-glutamine glutaminase family protein [Sediminibacterium sp.]